MSGPFPFLQLALRDKMTRMRSPRKFLDREQVTQLAGQMPGHGGGGRTEAATGARRCRRRQRRKTRPLRRLLQTVVATTADNEAFGWQVATEVHRRGLDQASRKACLGDGSQEIWALFALHQQGSEFIGIVDFLHLLVHLYAAAWAMRLTDAKLLTGIDNHAKLLNTSAAAAKLPRLVRPEEDGDDETAAG